MALEGYFFSDRLLATTIIVYAADPNPESFLGNWEGKWSPSSRNVWLTIIKVHENKVDLVYDWDATPAARNVFASTRQELTGELVDPRTIRTHLVRKDGSEGPELTFVLNPDGTISGTWRGMTGIERTLFKRKQ